MKAGQTYRFGTTTYIPVGGVVFAITDSGSPSIVEKIPEMALASFPSEDNNGKTPTGVRTIVGAVATVADAIAKKAKSA